MPLRDHFRPPLADRKSWEGLCDGWPAMIVIESPRPRCCAMVLCAGVIGWIESTHEHKSLPACPICQGWAGPSLSGAGRAHVRNSPVRAPDRRAVSSRQGHPVWLLRLRTAAPGKRRRSPGRDASRQRGESSDPAVTSLRAAVRTGLDRPDAGESAAGPGRRGLVPSRDRGQGQNPL